MDDAVGTEQAQPLRISRPVATGSAWLTSHRHAVLWLLIPLLLELVTWQGMEIAFNMSPEAGWQTALQMALSAHLNFGTQIIFTYGPLGFLNLAPSGQSFMWFGSLAVLAYLYTVAARFALCLAVFTGARRSFGFLGGTAIALVVLRFGQFVDLPVLLIALVWALNGPRSPRTLLMISTAGGAAAGIEMLEKLTIGLFSLLMVVIFIAALPAARLRNALLAAAAFLVALIGMWLVCGQPLELLPRYLRATEQVCLGYTSAMELPGPTWMPLAALAILALGLWGAWQSFGAESSTQRLGACALWVCFWWAMFKEGMVRADAGHYPEFFAAAINGLCAFRWRRRMRIVGLAGLGAVAVCMLIGNMQTVDGAANIAPSFRAAYTNAADVMVPSRRDSFIRLARAEIIRGAAVPEQALRLLRGHTVDVYPALQHLAWAYGLKWRPIPSIEGYTVYTPWLDAVNAKFIASRQAPTRILTQTGAASIDGRILQFDEPRTTIAILCHYHFILGTAAYSVLGRTRNRCGAEQYIATARAGWGQVVRVPAPPDSHSLVLVKITGVQVSGFETLIGLLWKPAIRTVTINGAAEPNRLVEAVAGDGLPLSAAPGVDFPFPFGMTASAKTIAVSKIGEPPTSSPRLVYRFYALRVAPARISATPPH